MLWLFAIAIFTSASLLFLLQPLAGKILLPLLGGSPSVWNTCMVFFQGTLLLGYFYAHVLTTRVPRRHQPVVHLVVMALAAATLPIPVEVGTPGAGSEVRWLLITLSLTVGPAFFVLATSGPLLQRWFSTTSHTSARDPYFLYAASNAGSILGLMAYPFLLEPSLSRRAQSIFFTAGFAAFGVMAMLCALASRQSATAPVAPASPAAPERASGDEPREAPVTWKRRFTWLALAAVPSSLMLGVTQHISTDLAAIPLLWIIPLTIYLLTFIIAFSAKVRLSAPGWGRIAPPLVVLVLFTMLAASTQPFVLLTLLHLATFFVCAMVCHKRLAEDRPRAEHLTEFYLMLSVGGVVGGAFNALVAPVAFTDIVEYPLVLGLVCLLRPQTAREMGLSRPWARLGIAVVAAMVLVVLVLNIDAAVIGRRVENAWLITALRAGLPAVLCMALLLGAGSLRFGLAATGLLVASTFIGIGGDIAAERRTFFGVHRVIRHSGGAWVQLSHGTTLHGVQATNIPLGGVPSARLTPEERFDLLFKSRREINPGDEPAWRPLIPTTYYHPTGPIGDVFKMLTEQNRMGRIALVGLGTGSLAAYAVPGVRMTYYEIDPAVIEIAADPRLFTFITDAARDPAVQIGYELGDGRLRLAATPEGPFDLIVLDAFSSDSIPVHLLTLEAVRGYAEKLAPRGLIAFHISNRYFNLIPPLQRIATELGLRGYLRNDTLMTASMKAEAKRESLWLVMAKTAEDFAPYSTLPTWERLAEERDFPLWTDDYSNLMRVMQWRTQGKSDE